MKLIALLSCLAASGCATASRINCVDTGMTKKQVISCMGQPTSISAMGDTQFLNYALLESFGATVTTPYAVQLVGGRVVSYGRQGDFGTTQQTKQVIEVINGQK